MTRYFCLDAPGYWLPTLPEIPSCEIFVEQKIAHYLAPSRYALGLTLSMLGQEPPFFFFWSVIVGYIDHWAKIRRI